MFETVANKYDVMNDAMSIGIHRVWKDVLIERLAPMYGTKLLDVAGGTGNYDTLIKQTFRQAMSIIIWSSLVL